MISYPYFTEEKAECMLHTFVTGCTHNNDAIVDVPIVIARKIGTDGCKSSLESNKNKALTQTKYFKESEGI